MRRSKSIKPVGATHGSASRTWDEDTARSGPAFSPRPASEYSLWVGNIPSSADILSIRDFFSRPTTQNLTSISYSPESNYAFVNFHSERDRIEAIERAASTVFQGRRLDCRLRTASTSRSLKISYGLAHRPGTRPAILQHENDTRRLDRELSHFPEFVCSELRVNKYFIIKSFSLEVMYHSLETNRWYIPRRHAHRLNAAFQTAGKVYLIFSVTGSGSFFGYAVMKSEIACEPEGYCVAVDRGRNPPQAERRRAYSVTAHDKIIPSPPVSQGTVVFHVSRKLVVWTSERLSPAVEAGKRPGSEGKPALPSRMTSNSNHQVASEGNDSVSHQALDTLFVHDDEPLDRATLLSKLAQFGSPCDIKWMSSTAIPFEDIRGIRNPWNENREVHVARNVTPLHPRAGCDLLNVWKQKGQDEV